MHFFVCIQSDKHYSNSHTTARSRVRTREKVSSPTILVWPVELSFTNNPYIRRVEEINGFGSEEINGFKWKN